MNKYYVFDSVQKHQRFDEILKRDDFFRYYKSALLSALLEKNLLTNEQYEQCLLLQQKQAEKGLGLK